MLTSSAKVVLAYQLTYVVAVCYTEGDREFVAKIEAEGLGDRWVASYRAHEKLEGGRFHRSEERRGGPDREEVAAWLMTKVCPWENLL